MRFFFRFLAILVGLALLGYTGWLAWLGLGFWWILVGLAAVMVEAVVYCVLEGLILDREV